jgi:hypothetical protein
MFAAGMQQIGRVLEPQNRRGGRPQVGRRVRRRDRRPVESTRQAEGPTSA